MKQSTLGTIAMLITLIYTGLSMPVQIVQTWNSKNTSNFSLFMLVMLYATFSSWVIYALKGMNDEIKINWHILIPNFLGAVCALILVIFKLNF
jgi:uncharacterized protein with PQ loop repeat